MQCPILNYKLKLSTDEKIQKKKRENLSFSIENVTESNISWQTADVMSVKGKI